MIFPKDFIWGVATSATQVEGAVQADGRGMSIWDVFASKKGAIADGSKPDIACDMYHRWPEDIKLMKEMGVDSYRFSFSWSRIFPEGKGAVNQKGVDFYKRMVEDLHKYNIMPNATLYHWDLPYALEEQGGWLNRDVAGWFGDYASFLFHEFGDAIPLWTTVNEPIATYVGYADGIFAPGLNSERFGRQANHHILLAHGEGVQRFRGENLKSAQIGVVVDIWHHHPLRENHPLDISLAELENEKAYRSFLNPIFKGSYTDALLKYMEERQCMPNIQAHDMKKISEPIDFFGLNCYNRVVDCADPALLKKSRNNAVGGNYMDNGTEYYPRAVYDALHILKEDYNVTVPVYITENGTYNCNEELTVDGRVHDTERIAYVEGFLQWISKALEEGMDIRGYYVWSLMDNWEWCGGYTFRYGLIHNDFQTQKRTFKDSAYWYRDFVREMKNKE